MNINKHAFSIVLNKNTSFDAIINNNHTYNLYIFGYPILLSASIMFDYGVSTAYKPLLLAKIRDYRINNNISLEFNAKERISPAVIFDDNIHISFNPKQHIKSNIEINIINDILFNPIITTKNGFVVDADISLTFTPLVGKFTRFLDIDNDTFADLDNRTLGDIDYIIRG